MIIRAAEAKDIDQITKVHLEAFRGHRAVALGKNYVKRGHEWFLGQADTVNLVAEHEGRIVGFVEGAPEGYAQRMARALMWVGFKSILFRPWLLARANYRFAVRQRLARFVGASQDPPRPPSIGDSQPFVLVSIAVAEDMRGQRLGGALMQAFEDHVRRDGYDSMRLSVYRDNEQAIRAYERAGWLRMESIDRHGEYFYKRIMRKQDNTASNIHGTD